jgi:hypothetical protein
MVNQASLNLKRGWTGFFWRQSMAVCQVLNDDASIVRFNLKTIQKHHSPNRLLPTLRRTSLIGDPAHASVGIPNVTRTTYPANYRTCDRNTVLTVRRAIGGLGPPQGCKGNRHDSSSDGCFDPRLNCHSFLTGHYPGCL